MLTLKNNRMPDGNLGILVILSVMEFRLTFQEFF
jgi:hypothetical protein